MILKYMLSGSLLTVCLFSSHLATGGPILGQIDTFQDGTAGNWQGGGQATHTNASSVVTDGGPAGTGDHYFKINSSTSDTTAAPRLLAISFVPTTEWTGNFIDAGVTAVSMDLLNPNPSTTLVMRIAFRDGTSGSSPAYVTDDAHAITLGPNSGWTHVTFQISASVMTTVGSPGDFTAFLKAVQEFRIVDSAIPPPSFQGDTFGPNTFFGVDNIAAVPEPASSALIALAGASLLIFKRRLFV